MNTLEITVNEYQVVQTRTGSVTVMRNGLPWKDCTGDGLIMALACEVESLRQQPTITNSYLVIFEDGSIRKTKTAPDDTWSLAIGINEVIAIIDISNPNAPKIAADPGKFEGVIQIEGLPADPPANQKWVEFCKNRKTLAGLSPALNAQLPDLLHQFEVEVDTPTKELESEFDEDDFKSLTTGWAIAKGLKPLEAKAFASLVRYSTPMG